MVAILLGHKRGTDEQVHIPRCCFERTQHDAQLLIKDI